MVITPKPASERYHPALIPIESFTLNRLPQTFRPLGAVLQPLEDFRRSLESLRKRLENISRLLENARKRLEESRRWLEVLLQRWETFRR